MEVIANAVKSHPEGQFCQGLVKDAFRMSNNKTEILNKVSQNGGRNFQLASKSVAGASECKDIAEGIAKGDFIQAGVNGGLFVT